MCQFLSECQCALAACAGLVRIAKRPQGPRQKRGTCDPHVLSMQCGMRAVVLGIIEGVRLFEMRARQSNLAQPEQGGSQEAVRCHQENWVALLLRHRQELFSQLPGRLQLGALIVGNPHSTQDYEQLREIPNLLTQLPCPRIDCSYFRSCKALGGNQ